MKKLLSLLLCLLLMLTLASAALANPIDYCKYGAPESPCSFGWSIDRDAQTHTYVCFNHVEDKEDINSHVIVSGPDACTPDEGGVCSGCGWDYITEGPEYSESEAYLLELFLLTLESGENPIDMGVVGSSLSLGLSDAALENADAFGFPLSEALLMPTEFTLSLEGSGSYPYTGEPIEPAALTYVDAYGPAKILLDNYFLEISEITYENNVEPGTATASVILNVVVDDVIASETLTVDFTITGSSGSTGGTEFEWPLPSDKALQLPADLTEVSSYAFAGIDTEVVIVPEGCESIAYTAFADCPNLESVIVYGGDTQISYAAFEGCGMITIFAPEGSAVEAYALEMGYNFAPLSE